MLLVSAVELPVSLPPMMHEVIALQLLTVAPAQQACVCAIALKPATPSTPLPVSMAYVPLAHHLLAASLAQPYYSAWVVASTRQTTSFWVASVSLLQSTIMARH